MKQKLFFTMITAFFITAVHAQKRSAGITAYAITASEKGYANWTEVKLIDLVSGEVVQSVYQNNSETVSLNARTKKAIAKHDELRTDKPFATNSAACAYDQKHERLYYTPMGINQLRYIDLRSNAIYYFEDEPFGVSTGSANVQNMVTRMVIAADGNGYALTNNGKHLIKFTTNKKATITDLGTLTDDASNGETSIHSFRGYGGDMVADESGNLYVITANRNVFKVNIESRIAIFKGMIKGLPEGFTANGAAVENGTEIIISSATTTKGYYKFDLQDMQAVKISTATSVFNTADLANATLVSDKNKDAAIKNTEENKLTVKTTSSKAVVVENSGKEKLAVYPNPVSTGSVRINFTDYAVGNYELQLIDLSGKMISTQSIILNNKTQVQEYKLPALLARGTYLLKIMNSGNRVVNTEKLIVE